MNKHHVIDKKCADSRLLYERPGVQRVELAIDETLAHGCKLGSNPVCVGGFPPLTSAGS